MEASAAAVLARDHAEAVAFDLVHLVGRQGGTKPGDRSMVDYQSADAGRASTNGTISARQVGTIRP